MTSPIASDSGTDPGLAIEQSASADLGNLLIFVEAEKSCTIPGIIIDTYELSTMQAGMLGHSLREPSSGIDIEHIVIRLNTGFDLPSFDAAWQLAVARHPALRTSFSLDATHGLLQQVLANFKIKWAVEDLSGLSLEDFSARLERLLEDDSCRGFDLADGPPWRLTLLRGPGTKHIVVWTFHHCILDARSFAIVLREVFANYDALLTGKPVPQHPLCRPYRDYIDWLQSLDLNAAERHWRHLLVGFRTPTRLWIERSRTYERPTGQLFGHVETFLSAELTQALESIVRREGASVNAALQAAWAILLSRLSRESDVMFGATRACRHSVAGSRDMVGLFINTLPVRAQIDSDADLGTVLRELRDQGTEVRPFEHTPLNKVQAWSELPRGSQLFESILVFDTESLDSRLRTDEPQWADRHFRYVGQTNYPLALIAYGGKRLQLRIEYEVNRFEPSDAERLLRYLTTLLGQIAIASDACKVRDLRILPDEERAGLIEFSQPLLAAASDATLHGLFEAQARQRPDATAVACEQQSLTYGELNSRANRLAHELRRRGVLRGELVGLAVERSLDIPIGILAILKAGGAYLPLDPSYPEGRLAFMLEDGGVRFVLAQPAVAARFAPKGIEFVRLDGLDSANYAVTDPEPVATPGDLAYVIYTSGSTGKPKGVQVTHANVCRLFTATQPWFEFGPHDVWTLFHSYAFDFSVWELWGALLYGGRLVVVPYWVSRDPAAFRKMLVDEQVTVLNQTPSAFRQLIQADVAQPHADYALRTVIFGGEALELHSLKPWFERYGDQRPQLVNMYGITETTVHVTYRPITRADVAAGLGSVIGVPIPDLYLRLLDARGEPVPVGVPGEIWVGGAGVARGYLNRPELTAERFVADPFDASGQQRLYRSGDLARRLANGDLEFLGRIDAQVKIRGFRIELGEIEAALVACAEVADAAVIVREDAEGDKRLVAYVVAGQVSTLQIETLRSTLGERLPGHMVPAHFVRLDALPLNANGKLDRAALPAPSGTERLGGRAGRDFVEPRTQTERIIAQVWADVLRLRQVGATDDFFELGGDSILSIQVVARCRQAGIVISTRELFEHPTIAELSRRASLPEPAAPDNSAAPLGRLVVLTPIQQWFFEHDFSANNHWNQAFLFQVPASIDIMRFQRCLEIVVLHHDALRVRFRKEGIGWLAELTATVDAIEAQHHDLSSEPPEKWASLIEAHCAAGQATLDIERGPLLHAAHFDLGAGVPGRLFLAVHHLAVDGVSWRILLEDLEIAYDCLSREQPVSLPRKTTSFPQWANRLVEQARSESVSGSLATWQALMAAPASLLQMQEADTLERDAITFTVELTAEETAALLHDVPSAYHTQINDVLLTALAQVLQRSTRGSSFLIDMEGHGREDIGSDLDVSRTVGWFTTLFPVRLELANNVGTGAALKSVKEQLRRVPHRGLSYGLLRYSSGDASQAATLACGSRPQVLFNYLGQIDQMTAGSELFSFATEPTGPWHAPNGRRTHPIEILAQVRDGKLRADWITCEQQIPRTEVRSLANDFMAALRAIIAHCKSPCAGGRTPADFPLATLRQCEVDELWRRYPGLADAYPLTPMQRLFYVMEQAGAGVGLEQWQFRVDGGFEPRLLRRAFEQVIARHPILRTAFLTPGQGEPIQIVLPATTLPWHEKDWRDLDDGAREIALHRHLEEDVRSGLDLTRPPLMRVTLLRLAETAWHLVWTTHHLCIDGWSWPRLFQEIAATYAALQEQRSPAFEPAPSFGTYVGWLNRHISASEAFWKEALAGLTAATPLPLSAASASAPGPRMTTAPVELETNLSRAATENLKLLASANQVTLGTLIQSGWALLLAHYSTSNDVLFGASFSGRPEELDGVETLIGPCVTNVPVRATFTGDEPIRSWLVRHQRQQLDLNQHQYTPIDVIQSLSGIPWHSRLFDSLVVFQNYQVDSTVGRLGRHARIVPIKVPESTSYALTVVVTPADELKIKLIYNQIQLQRDTVEAIMTDLTAVLAALGCSLPDASVGDVLAVLPKETRGKAAAAKATPLAVSRSAPTAAPRGEVERKLAAIWRQLLGQKPIGIDDNFFDIGGQSILLVRAHRLIEEDFARRLPIVALLQFPTIRALATQLALAPSGPGDASSPADAVAERARKQREALARQRNRERTN